MIMGRVGTWRTHTETPDCEGEAEFGFGLVDSVAVC